MSRVAKVALTGWLLFAGWWIAVWLAPPAVAIWLLPIHSCNFEPEPGPALYSGRAVGVIVWMVAWLLCSVRRARADEGSFLTRWLRLPSTELRYTMLWVVGLACALGLVGCALLEAMMCSAASATGAVQAIFGLTLAGAGLGLVSGALRRGRPRWAVVMLHVFGILVIVSALAYMGLLVMVLRQGA